MLKLSQSINLMINNLPIIIDQYQYSLFSKIVQKLMYNRLLNYINDNKILVDNQYGFREGHSTYMALRRMVNNISEWLDDKNYWLGLLIDLSKAFDTINHKLLFTKLNYNGITEIALQWFADYLTNRLQYVSINNKNSNMLPVECWVPQGSILEPLLFLIFINDIANSSKLLDFITFADDTNIFFLI